jgi:putative NADH-flavin reductase
MSPKKEIRADTIFYSPVDENKLTATDSNKRSVDKPDEQRKRPNRIVLFGATGGTGLQIIEQAILLNYKLVAAVRNTAALDKYKDKIEVRKVNVYDRNSVEEVIKDADVVISSLGSGTLSQGIKSTDVYSKPVDLILDAMNKFGVKRGLFLTSVGVDFDESFSWVYKKIIRPLIMNTYMDMMKLETIVERTDYPIDWTIVRPSELIDSKKSKEFHAGNRFMNGGNQKISRKDVAKFVIHEMENNLWVKKYPALSYN